MVCFLLGSKLVLKSICLGIKNKNTIIDDKQVLPTKPDNFTYDDTTMQEDNEYFNQEKAKNRRSCIMTDALSFLNSNNVTCCMWYHVLFACKIAF